MSNLSSLSGLNHMKQTTVLTLTNPSEITPAADPKLNYNKHKTQI